MRTCIGFCLYIISSPSNPESDSRIDKFIKACTIAPKVKEH